MAEAELAAAPAPGRPPPNSSCWSSRCSRRDTPAATTSTRSSPPTWRRRSSRRWTGRSWRWPVQDPPGHAAWLNVAIRPRHRVPEPVAPAGARCAGGPPHRGQGLQAPQAGPVLPRPGSGLGGAPGGSAGPGPVGGPVPVPVPVPVAESAARFRVRAWGDWHCRGSVRAWRGWRAPVARDAAAPIPAGCSDPSCPGRSGGTRCRTGRRRRCWAGPPAAASAVGPAPPGARRCADGSGPGCRCCFPGAGPAGRRDGLRPPAAGRPVPGASGPAGGRLTGGGRAPGGGGRITEGGRAEARRRSMPAVPRRRDDEHRTVHDRPPPARRAGAGSARGVEVDADRDERRRRADHEPESRPRVVDHADAERGGAREEDGGADPGAVDEPGAEDDHAAVAVHAHETGSVPDEHHLGRRPVNEHVTRVVDVDGGRHLVDVGWPLVRHRERPFRGGSRVPDPLIARPVTARVENHRVGRVDGVGQLRPLDPLELGRSVVRRPGTAGPSAPRRSAG